MSTYVYYLHNLDEVWVADHAVYSAQFNHYEVVSTLGQTSNLLEFNQFLS